MGLLKCDMAGEAEAEVVSVEFEVVAENRAVMRKYRFQTECDGLHEGGGIMKERGVVERAVHKVGTVPCIAGFEHRAVIRDLLPLKYLSVPPGE